MTRMENEFDGIISKWEKEDYKRELRQIYGEGMAALEKRESRSLLVYFIITTFLSVSAIIAELIWPYYPIINYKTVFYIIQMVCALYSFFMPKIIYAPSVMTVFLFLMFGRCALSLYMYIHSLLAYSYQCFLYSSVFSFSASYLALIGRVEKLMHGDLR